MDRKDIVELLDSPPLPASAGLASLVKRINKQQQAIRFLLESLAVQGTAILDIRTKMVDHKGAIEGLGNIITGDEDEEPKVILPHQGLVGFRS